MKDDGQGVDLDRLVAKAVDKQIISKEMAATMTDQMKLNLIFQDGLTTKEKVSDYSGRGIGMDVVKANIESLGGSLQFESVPGKGSRFLIIFPKAKLAELRHPMAKMEIHQVS